MIDYCLGFAFDLDLERVLLIEKTKPENQKGRLNGVGGKLEPGELGVHAMVREFEEEVTAKTKTKDWTYCGVMTSPRWRIGIYSTQMALLDWASPTEEKLEIKRIDKLWEDDRVLFNLHWLIPMCLDEEVQPFNIKHT